MKVCYLHKKRLDTSKEKVHAELVDYFVDIEKQKAVWHFTIAMRSLISRNEISSGQANTLLTRVMDLFAITSVHIESARAFMPSRKRLATKFNNVIQLKQMGISAVDFEKHLEALEFFYHEKSLQFSQGLVIARLLLRHYPKTEELLNSRTKTNQKRRLAIN